MSPPAKVRNLHLCLKRNTPWHRHRPGAKLLPSPRVQKTTQTPLGRRWVTTRKTSSHRQPEELLDRSDPRARLCRSHQLWMAAVATLADEHSSVQKYFAPQQVPRAAVVPAPRPTAQQAAGGQPAVAASDGLGTQTGVAGQTPQTDVLVTSNSSGASGTDKAASASSNDAGSAQNPLQLSQEDAAALLLQKVDPVYPQAALREHVEGSVELQANIGKDGSTSNLKSSAGNRSSPLPPPPQSANGSTSLTSSTASPRKCKPKLPSTSSFRSPESSQPFSRSRASNISRYFQ